MRCHICDVDTDELSWDEVSLTFGPCEDCEDAIMSAIEEAAVDDDDDT